MVSAATDPLSLLRRKNTVEGAPRFHDAANESGKNRSELKARLDAPKRLMAAAKPVPHLRKELTAGAVGGKDEALRISAVPRLRELIDWIEAAVAGRRFGRKTVRERPSWGRVPTTADPQVGSEFWGLGVCSDLRVSSADSSILRARSAAASTEFHHLRLSGVEVSLINLPTNSLQHFLHHTIGGVSGVVPDSPR